MSDPLTNTTVIQADSISTWDPVLKRYVDLRNSVAASTYTKTEVDSKLATKASVASTYTKTDVDSKLATKASVASTYTKTEVDGQLATKASQATTYTKTEVDGQLATKASQATTYTKTDVDGKLSTKAPQESTYTKDEVDGQLATKAAQTSTYSKAEVDGKLTTAQEALSDGLAGKQDTLTFAAPLSLTDSTLGVDFSGHTLMTGSLEVVKDGIFLEDLLCGRDCYITRALAANTLSNLDSDGTNPPITVTSNMACSGDLSADTIRAAGTLHVGGGITCSNPTSSSIIANKNLSLGETGDQHGDSYLHFRNRDGERGVIFETTNTDVPLLDLNVRLSNGVRRAIRLEDRPEFSFLEPPTWQLGGANPGGLGQLLVADTRCAVRNKLGVGTVLEYANALAVNGSIVASAYNYFSDASLKDDVLDVDESECVAMLEAVASKTYRRNDLDDEGRRIGFIAQDLRDNAPAAFNVWAPTTADGVEILTVDYARLSAILWGVCRNLNARLAALEAGS